MSPSEARIATRTRSARCSSPTQAPGRPGAGAVTSGLGIYGWMCGDVALHGWLPSVRRQLTLAGAVRELVTQQGDGEEWHG